MNIDRKTAGVLYLETLFKPLLKYIGQLPNGSRYTVLTYKGYDADSDTMIINTPYIYQIWKLTQKAYFDRQERIEAAQTADKRPKNADLKPLELNKLIKGPAVTEDAATLEMAIYITNVMVAVGKGKAGKINETRIKFKTLINQSPRMKQRITDIETAKLIELGPDPTEEEIKAADKAAKIVANRAAYINSELKKIETAISLILNPDKCSATEYFEIMELEPTKYIPTKGQTKFIPPTKGRLNDELMIKWTLKKELNK